MNDESTTITMRVAYGETFFAKKVAGRDEEELTYRKSISARAVLCASTCVLCIMCVHVCVCIRVGCVCRVYCCSSFIDVNLGGFI